MDVTLKKIIYHIFSALIFWIYLWSKPDLKAKAEDGGDLPGGNIICKFDVVLFDASDSSGGLGFQFFLQR